LGDEFILKANVLVRPGRRLRCQYQPDPQ